MRVEARKTGKGWGDWMPGGLEMRLVGFWLLFGRAFQIPEAHRPFPLRLFGLFGLFAPSQPQQSTTRVVPSQPTQPNVVLTSNTCSNPSISTSIHQTTQLDGRQSIHHPYYFLNLFESLN